MIQVTELTKTNGQIQVEIYIFACVYDWCFCVLQYIAKFK